MFFNDIQLHHSKPCSVNSFLDQQISGGLSPASVQIGITVKGALRKGELHVEMQLFLGWSQLVSGDLKARLTTLRPSRPSEIREPHRISRGWSLSWKG